MKMNIKIKAFSLVESLVALALFGMILLMMSPLIMGRSQKTAEVHCVDSGVKIVRAIGSNNGNNWLNNAVLDIQPGMSKIYVTITRTGTDGTRDTVRSDKLAGPDAGTSYKPFYKTIDLSQVDPSSSFVQIGVKVFSNANGVYPQGIWGCTAVDVNGNCTVRWQRLSGDQDIFADNGGNPINDATLASRGLTLADNEILQVSRKATLRPGIPYNSTFLGPLFGVGGRGGDQRFGCCPEGRYRTAREKYARRYDCSYDNPARPLVCQDSAFIMFEWPADCIITEDVDR